MAGWLARFTDLVAEVDSNRSAFEYERGSKRRSAADRELYWGLLFSSKADEADGRGDRRAAQEFREDARLNRHTSVWLRREEPS